MKRITFWFYILFIFLIINKGYGQGIDKPQYQVEVHRAGSYLGTFNLELFPLIAPLATANFDSLVSVQFYDSTAFHRVVPGFVIQGGDPNSIHGPKSTWGYGNPNQPTVPAEFSVVRHYRGRLGAARDVDTNSATSQFYICDSSAFFLDGDYTVYGQVISGMDIVDTIVNEPRDANDIPILKIEMFVTFTGVNDSIPDAPVLVSPPDLSQGILKTTSFQWSSVNTAVMYTLEISPDSTFTTGVLARNAPLTATTMPQLVGSTLYYWRVKSNNGGHENISSVFSFNTAVGAANLISPVNGATNTFINPVFQWNSVPNATDYTIDVYKSSTFIPTNLVFTQMGIVDTSIQIPAVLATNKLYYWRIRSVSGSIPGFFSSIWTFTTGTSVGINEPANSEKNVSVRSIYPNPARNNFTVEILLNKPGVVEVSLKNISGTIVYSLSKKVTGNKYNPVIDVSKMNKGVYFLSVKMNGEEVTRKIEVN